jgi:hypothetical protein
MVVSAEVTQLAVPELTATVLQSEVVPTLKVIVPAATGETVAVSVTLAPEGTVVTVVLGADVSAALSVVVVVAAATVTVEAVETLAT